jgi:hypothetical protein
MSTPTGWGYPVRGQPFGRRPILDLTPFQQPNCPQ